MAYRVVDSTSKKVIAKDFLTLYGAKHWARLWVKEEKRKKKKDLILEVLDQENGEIKATVRTGKDDA